MAGSDTARIYYGFAIPLKSTEVQADKNRGFKERQS